MLSLEAHAKINWTLDILGRRDDGYHLMDMLMQTVSLCDTLTFESCDALAFEVRAAAQNPLTGADAYSAANVPVDESNLVCRAARALCAYTGKERGAKISLTKCIPSGAGMGGGSADAAATLVGLNELWSLGLSMRELLDIGLRLGADVPFMLTGGLARVGGIGEKITPLFPAPAVWLALTQPCDGLSTREIFTAFDALAPEKLQRPDTERAQAALLAGDLRTLGKAMGNVLEAVSVQKRAAIAHAAQWLCGLGALCAMMTGSGSVVYGVFEREEDARRACMLGAKESGGYWAVCRSLPSDR